MKEKFLKACRSVALLGLLILAVIGFQQTYQAPKCCPKRVLPKNCPVTPHDTLIQEGKHLRVTSLLGKPHPVLQKMAEEHARYQARVQVQGHQHWQGDRDKTLLKALPECNEVSEVVAESSPGQDVEAAAKEMYRCWKLSPGHWACVDGTCAYWGYAMARGSNGVWYATGIFAQRR